MSYEEYLLALLEAESETREENQRQRRLKQAAFPVQKTLDSYDFSLMPSLKSKSFSDLIKRRFCGKEGKHNFSRKQWDWKVASGNGDWD